MVLVLFPFIVLDLFKFSSSILMIGPSFCNDEPIVVDDNGNIVVDVVVVVDGVDEEEVDIATVEDPSDD